jgi:lipoyl-dependent peroxiredoxin subunit C
MLNIGDYFPQFKVKACIGANKDNLTTIDNSTYDGKWVIYFFYPKDFTAVCNSEIVEFNRQLNEFIDRDCMVVGGSTDNEYCHMAWCQSHEDLQDLQYPLVSAQVLGAELDILDANEGFCYRATFLVDPHGIIQWTCCNPVAVGRSIPEILRVVDAIQSDEFCPCNWQKGDAPLAV